MKFILKKEYEKLFCIIIKFVFVRYAFICGDWLSEKHSDGQTWRTLYPAEPDELDGNIMLNEMSKNHLFEDHLWLSVSMRPHFSRFSRVQRLWTIVSLLFLSMIASAMWYNTSDPSGGSTVSLGPLKLNYKIVYVGFMSAVIAAIPSLIIMLIFKNRRLKGEGKHDNKIHDNSQPLKYEDF
ncbi:hypothetical protein KUTeg_023077 [Tegillarca granosa]|uniref:Uncharacterized protein n=1 Tax=Tegillarca granosa TaxID=220873 RepID=A0ABQ9E176_TEGGR|nr:hypothetical protein KUTeg_023077 [Tegillarca granosa]